LELDLVIENGWVADGISSSLYRGTIGIVGETIDCIYEGSRHLRGRQIIDATDFCVAPGFIDVNSHVDHFLFLDPVMEHKLKQGVTTEIGGNSGCSAYPWNGVHAFHIPDRREEFAWPSFGAFLEELEKHAIAPNFGSLVGHCSLSGKLQETNASSSEAAGPREIRELLIRSLEEGAFGLSTRTDIQPGFEVSLSEIGELGKFVAKKNGVLSIALRNEADQILEALAEAVLVAGKSDVSLQISHFKTLDRTNWSKQERALELIEKMRLLGMNINIDAFPYTVACAPLRVLMPPQLTRDEGKFREHSRRPSVLLEVEDYVTALFPEPSSYRSVTFPYLENQRHQHLRGMDLYSAAKLENRDPSSLILSLAISEGLNRFVYYDCISRSNKVATIRDSATMVASDAFPTSNPSYFKNSIIHPRTFGTFPQYLSDFVYRDHILTLPSAIKKITSVPAHKFGLCKRGVISEGAYADITIFDPKSLAAGASVSNPCGQPTGIGHVIVNGRIVLEHGEFTGVFPGKVLRRGA